MFLSQCASYNIKKSKFIKEQEAGGLLDQNVCIRWCFFREKMNPITNKFFLAGDRFMLEMHSRQSGFSYSACGLYTKNKEKIQKFKEVGDQINLSGWTRQHLFSTWFDLRCIINLLRRTASNKVLCDKSFEIAGNSKYDGHQLGLPSIVHKFLKKI